MGIDNRFKILEADVTRAILFALVLVGGFGFVVDEKTT